MNISYRISIILVALFTIIAPRCHALSDFAGQGKAPRTWNELMNPRVDPSRVFAVPGGHGDHPAGGYTKPSVAKADQPATPEVKPDESKDPNPPHVPMVRPPKPQPEPKPEVKPDCKPKPEVKPDEHKCWSFKFRTPKADCKHETAKPDKKPSCNRGFEHKKSECSKSSRDKSGCKAPGMKGHGLGHRGGKHGVGKGRR